MKYYFSFILLFLAGCAELPLPPAVISPAMQSLWQANQVRLATVNRWRLNGRIAILTENEDWTANVHWQQQDKMYQLVFKAPLGQTIMSLEGQPENVIMRTSKGETFDARDADSLIVKVMNLEIPVTNLYFWVRGIPAPEPQPTDYRLTEDGHLYSLQQAGWNVAYKRYLDIQGVTLPDKLFLENSRFKVKIAVSEWEIGTP
ncbi:MAG: outer membrane lipoprotein LolB [Beggiatoa sp. IS2]|nr:MAG: outer membrane lipoprotein LolB [Beggiatoa sp. IS2]